MNALFVQAKRFVVEEEGAVAIEYALLAALIGIAIIATVILMRNQICGVFNTIANALTNAATGAAAPTGTDVC